MAGFWLHLLCLLLAGSVGEKRYKPFRIRRLVLSAFLCACADAAVLVLGHRAAEQWMLLFFGAAFSGILFGAWIAFGRKRLLQNSVLLFAVTVLLSGFLALLPVRNTGVLCMAGSILLPILRAGGAALFRAKQTGASIYETTLEKGTEEQHFAALMDTGNRLRLYGSRIPVVLVDETYLAGWITEAKEKAPQKLVFLPYKGVGGRGLLHGVRVQCRVSLENKKVISGEVAAVAAGHRLFTGCEYQMILQPEVLSFPVRVCVKNAQEGERNVI